MIKKTINVLISTISVFFLTSSPAFAHVIVTPKQVGIAVTQEFSMAVPSERDTPTVAIKLLIPKGVQAVMPNVKAGWTITTSKDGDTVTEIDWTNGTIPPEQRDVFFFQAQVPATETLLSWKAYQRYQDGTVISWDHTPTANPEDDAAPPPYSTTQVINDLTGTAVNMQKKQTSGIDVQVALWISSIALGVAAISLGFVLKKHTTH